MNDAAFNILYNKWYRKSIAFAKSFVHDEMAAEDIVCEAMLKLSQAMREKPIDKPEILLLTMLRNKSLDYLKHEAIRKEVEQELAEAYQYELNLRISTLEDCVPSEVLVSEINDIVKKTLDSLPEQTRNIYIMKRINGYPVKKISEKQGLTIKAVEYHITRALKALRENLKDYLPFFLFLF
ncbi:MAG: RNA polymerase sigma-70 factor [Tannerella sp.]|nr:RNA polymerase sigma-70 factor [Tannerella sp.]